MQQDTPPTQPESEPAQLTLADIRAAHGRLFDGAGTLVRQTPLMRMAGSALDVDCAEVWFKLEQLQIGGSFKARGMFNLNTAVTRPPEAPEAG